MFFKHSQTINQKLFTELLSFAPLIGSDAYKISRFLHTLGPIRVFLFSSHDPPACWASPVVALQSTVTTLSARPPLLFFSKNSLTSLVALFRWTVEPFSSHDPRKEHRTGLLTYRAATSRTPTEGSLLPRAVAPGLAGRFPLLRPPAPGSLSSAGEDEAPWKVRGSLASSTHR